MYPNSAQEAVLRQWCGSARWVWNEFVRHNKDRYRSENKFSFHAELSAMLPKWKQEKEWLNDPPAISLVDVSRRYDKALQKALKDRKKTGKKAGFPKWHKKREGWASLYLTGQGLKLLRNENGAKAVGWLRLPKEAGNIKIRGGRWPEGEIRSARIRQQHGDWTLSIQYDGPVADQINIAPGNEILCVDLGLDALVACSDGTKESAPKFYRKAQYELGRMQRRYGREDTRRQKAGQKKEDRSRRQKARQRKIAALHRKVALRRKDHTHKVSRALITKAQTLAIETLGVAAMMRNRRQSKSVQDAGWSELVRQVEYKAEWHGRDIRRMGRFDRSTGCCPDCGSIGHRLDLKTRVWVCHECAVVHDRDLAAARWIAKHANPAESTADAGTDKALRRGLGLRRKPSGKTGPHGPERTADVEINIHGSVQC